MRIGAIIPTFAAATTAAAGELSALAGDRKLPAG
jgi:hypothetical protein